MTKITTTSLLADLQADVTKAKARLADARADRTMLSQDLSTAKRIVGATGLSHAFIDSYFRAPKIVATAVIKVDSFKTDRKLRNILTRGIELAEATGSEDFVADWIAERTFKFTLPNGGTLNVEARLRGDGKTCRRVKVGVERKTVTEARYEIVCD